jgi:hypothetical protein
MAPAFLDTKRWAREQKQVFEIHFEVNIFFCKKKRLIDVRALRVSDYH